MARKLQFFFDPSSAILASRTASRIQARIEELRQEIEASTIRYDETLGEYVATAITGIEVYGATRQECAERLREANRVWREHCEKCGEDRDD